MLTFLSDYTFQLTWLYENFTLQVLSEVLFMILSLYSYTSFQISSFMIMAPF